MKNYIGLLLVTLWIAACSSDERQIGYISLALPRQAATFQTQQEGAGFIDAPGVSRWQITVSADDIEAPIVVDTSEELVRIPVKAGLARVIRVSGRGAAVENISQGFSGETVIDVAEGAETEAVVDVYRSVTVADANLPVARSGGEAPATAPDVNEVTVTLQADSLLLTMSFNNEVEAPWSQQADGSVRGLIELDLDRNTQTGDASKVQARHRALRAATGGTEVDLPIGVDAIVDFSPASVGYVKLLTGVTSIPVAANFSARTLSVTIPYEQLGGKLSSVRFVAMAMDKKGSLDFAPEKDFVQISLVDETPAVAKLKAVAGFTGSFVAAFREGGFAPLPVLHTSPAGIHAAWLSPAGFDYAFSETGKLFGDRQSFSLKTNTFDFMNFDSQVNFDIDLSANAKGQPTIVVSQHYTQNLSPYAISTAVAVVQASDTGFSPVLETALEPTYDYYNSTSFGLGRAQVVSSEDTAIIAGVADSGRRATELFTVRNGAKVDSTLVTPMGNEQALIADGLGNFFFNYSLNVQAPAISVNQLALVAGKLTLTPSPSIGLSISNAGLHSAAGGKDSLYSVVVIPGGVFPDFFGALTVWDPAGIALVVPDALVSTSMPASGYSYPDIAVSKTGRVGVVWHTSTVPSMIMAAPAMRLAPAASDFPDTIYYSEKMPGAVAFSAPVVVGAGSYASIAFDALEQPVVLVSNVSVEFDPIMYSYSILSAELTAYQGE